MSTLVDEHAELERQLSQPETHADSRLAKKLNQRYAELTAIVTTWREWKQTAGDIEAARELGADDPDFAAEAERMVTHREELAERRRRLLARQQEEQDAVSSAARKSQIRTMDRSERIRTYNYAENRISDHRTGYKAYNLDQVMNGALEPVIASCIEADEEAQLAAVGDQAG